MHGALYAHIIFMWKYIDSVYIIYFLFLQIVYGALYIGRVRVY